MVRRGKCLVVKNGGQAELGPGQFVCLDDAEPHQVTSCGERLLIQIPRQIVLTRIRNTRDFVGRASSADAAADRYFAQTLENFSQNAPLMGAAAGAIALDRLVGLLPIASMIENDTRPASHWINRALAIVEANARDARFDSNGLADLLGVSRRYLDKVFEGAKSTATRTIWDHRLRHAAEALHSPADSHRTILEIAISSGFSDASHFSRMFQKRFGRSPKAFRRKGADCGAAASLDVSP
jgi:AraC family transcriptional regulator, positive regulator of tynA and feaB